MGGRASRQYPPPPSAAGDRLLGPPPPRPARPVARGLPSPGDASRAVPVPPVGTGRRLDASEGLGDADAVPWRRGAARRLKELNGEMDSTAIIKRSDLIRFQRHSLSLSVELHLHLQKMPRYHIFCRV